MVTPWEKDLQLGGAEMSKQSGNPTAGFAEHPLGEKKGKAVQGAIPGQQSSYSGYSELHWAECSSSTVLCKPDCPFTH